MSGLEPLLLIGMASTAVGGVVEAVGAVQEGEATAAAKREEAEIAKTNKVIADQDRRLAVRTAQIDASDMRRENRRTMASIRAAYGMSGGDLSGSPLDVLLDTASELELDVQRTEYEGRSRNREGALQMLGFQRDHDSALRGAAYARTSGALNAFGAVANTGARLVRMS